MVDTLNNGMEKTLKSEATPQNSLKALAQTPGCGRPGGTCKSKEVSKPVMRTPVIMLLLLLI